MLIDIVVLIFFVVAIFKGYSKGLIIAVFSVLGLVIGLAAALKLSVVTASRLKDAVHIAAKWLPAVAFAIVFLAVILLVRLGACAIEKIAAFAMLGWANRLAGIVLYMMLYTIILSVVLFYVEKLNLLSASTIASSSTYHFIQPWGPTSIDLIGSMIPFFKGMFQQLEDFFAGLSVKMQSS